jgi:hypothetical protein
MTTAGLAPGTGYGLLSGRRSVTPAAVVEVTSRTMPGRYVEAGGARLRLRALHVMGHGSARIARAAGVHPATIRALVRGDAVTVSPPVRDAITAVYEAWWDKRAPGRTRCERGAATAAPDIYPAAITRSTTHDQR